MGRLCRFASEGQEKRVHQFLTETEGFLNELEHSPKAEKFVPTFLTFQAKFGALKRNPILDDKWAEEALTWANILTHRAKLLK